jgi:hypothetical protein
MLVPLRAGPVLTASAWTAPIATGSGPFTDAGSRAFRLAFPAMYIGTPTTIGMTPITQVVSACLLKR